MESLALMVTLIALGITAAFMLMISLVWHRFLKKKWPHRGGVWWLLWVPLLLGLSFLFAILTLQIIVKING